MTQLTNNWGPAVIIILGYIIGFYFQNKRLDDFKIEIKEYMNIRFKVLEDNLTRIEKRLDKLEDMRLVK